jgi:hypothetical protein
LYFGAGFHHRVLVEFDVSELCEGKGYKIGLVFKARVLAPKWTTVVSKKCLSNRDPTAKLSLLIVED